MKPGSLVKNHYRVDRVHSEEGGMGAVLLVHDLIANVGPLALKYCREDDEEVRLRFRREVRLMQNFKGNNKVVQLLDADLEHEPPFIVMPFFSDGDLRSFRPDIETDLKLQEMTFVCMVDCVNELHRQSIFHRDIKPQNFLRIGKSIAVSDFGLGRELESSTQITRPSQFWGTQSYAPPEFADVGGFKNATAASDIFMLGKSFYALATGRDPQYINESLLPRPIASVIQKCCNLAPQTRFRSLAELKQALVTAYNIVLGRIDPLGKGDFILEQILELLKSDDKYDAEMISEFMEFFGNLEIAPRWVLVQRMPKPLFTVFSEASFDDKLLRFLSLYEEVVLSESDSWAYAETVADCMDEIFRHSTSNEARAKALEIAVRMAAQMNRFAAMDKCVSMITSVAIDDPVGAAVASVIVLNPEGFLAAIESITLKNADVRAGVLSIKAE